MTLDVTNTLDDYVEANAAHLAAAGGGTPKRRYLGCAGWVAFVTLAVLLYMLLRDSRIGAGSTSVAPAPRPGPASAPATPLPAPPFPLVALVLPLIPWLLIFGFIWFVVFRQLRKTQTQPQSSLFPPGTGRPEPSDSPAVGPPLGGALSGLFAVVLVIAALVLMVLNNAAPDVQPMKSLRDGPLGVLLPVVPWFMIFIAVVAILRRGRLGARRMWDGQPHLQRPKRIDITDDGMVVADAVTRMEYRWPGFTHVRETKNLFLLYVSNYGFHMVPKRAFATAAEVDDFRERVRRMIAERPGPAFPVLPLAGQSGA